MANLFDQEQSENSKFTINSFTIYNDANKYFPQHTEKQLDTHMEVEPETDSKR